MKKIFLTSIFLILGYNINAQDSTYVDEKYLEDQIYLSLTYNLLVQKINGVRQKGFSGGASAGFIKDIPINKQRNLAIGLGVGYAYNVYVQNLKIEQSNFSIATNYNINKFAVSAIEFPIEFRWRTSTPTKYKFWRVYSGIKMSYILNDTYKYSDATKTIKAKKISDINKLQYGLTIAAGYGFWNLQAYYGLRPVFKAENFNTMKEFKIGLIFYIL